MTATYTGFRASELATLTPDSFYLVDGDSSYVEVTAKNTKNKRLVQQPIREDFAKMLKGWLDGHEGPLWSRLACERSAEMLRVDLDAAGIPYETEDGILDFHALRVTYITELARAGVHPKIAQTLARHSSIELTMGSYTQLGRQDVVDALKALPKPPKPSKRRTK